MKVVFLDFDGVLNPYKNYKADCVFSKSAVQSLNDLLEKIPSLKIVVSSSWRHKGLDFVKEVLKKNGVDSSKVIDITDEKKREDRGKHVERWLSTHKEVSKFVILDDDNHMDKLMDRLVKTNSYVGLTEKDVRKALELLS